MTTLFASYGMLFRLLCLTILVVQINARCGYPELPNEAYIPLASNDNWQYFEEDSSIKVECTTGLLGRLRTDGDVFSSSNNYYNLSTSFNIICHDGKWDNSGLVCIKTSDYSSNSVHFKDVSSSSRTHSRMVQEPENLSALTDKDASTCVPLLKSTGRLTRKLVFRIDLKESTRISRIMLLLKHNSVQQQIHSTTPSPEMIDLNSLDAIENYILDVNDAADEDNETDNQKFMDFVYTTEFHNKNQTKNVQFSMLQSSSNSDKQSNIFRESKQFQINDQKVVVSASLGNDDIQTVCSFNEDANFQQNSTKMEMLVFDCGISNIEKSFKPKFFMIKIDLRQTDKSTQTLPIDKSSNVIFNLCGIESFELTEESCDKPYIPIYGTIKKIKKNDNLTVIEYGCSDDYFLVNTSDNVIDSMHKPTSKVVVRSCNRLTGQWSPSSVESLMCHPKIWCRAPPPMPNKTGASFKFVFEFTKLDHLRRAVGGHALATLRCQTLTEMVMPITIYACNMRGEWILLGGDNLNRSEPECRVSSSYRWNNGRHRSRHYYHHYYHLLAQQKANHSSSHLLGRPLNDNKTLVYFGIVGLILLFGGSFIVLFHVRRMAKKISRQMRERSYIGISNNEGSMVIGGMMDKNGYKDRFTDPLFREQEFDDYDFDADLDDPSGYPPYYNQNIKNNGRNIDSDKVTALNNYYNGSVAFSTDLPPPATPISMPSATVLERKTNSGSNNSKKYKNGLNLAANFDNVKF